MGKVRLVAALFFTVALMLCVGFCVSAEQSVSLDGIQIRLNEPYGIRYIATASGAVSDYDEVGMLIVPQNNLTGELTLETPLARKISSTNEKFNYFGISADNFEYTLCLIGLEYKNYATEYVVRPYAVYTADGVQQTIYGENYENYALTPATVTEKVLEKYADEYSADTARDYEAIDNNLTGYYKYLDELAESDDEPEPEEPEVLEYVTLNEFYWTIGTLGSTNGSANPTNSKRIFTPNYIPADGTIITYDSSSNVKYLVMEYDSNKKWLSSSDWITKDYVQKNDNAAFYRCAITRKDDAVLTKNDIAAVSAPVTIKVPGISLAYPQHNINFEKGTITGATGLENTTSTTRVYTPEYYPVEGLVVYFDASDANSEVYTTIAYDADKKLIRSCGDSKVSPNSVADIIAAKKQEGDAEAAYVRFVLKVPTGVTVTEENAQDIGSAFSISYNNKTKEVNHSFFEIGTINESGVGGGDAKCIFEAEGTDIYTLSYIPVGTSFEFDTLCSGAYSVSYYDSSYAFLSKINDQQLAESPAAPSGAAFYRISYCPGYTVDETLCDYAADAFTFAEKYTLTTSDWALGTISGTGVVTTGRTDRIYTPEYFPADGMEVNWTVNSYGSNYIYIGYDADKNCIGTSGDRSAATSTAKQFHPTAEYVRLVIKCSTITEDTISNVSDNIVVTTQNKLLTRKELDTTQEQMLETFGDEGLVFRFPITSMSSASPGNYNSGMCEVEDEIWMFSTADKGTAGDGYGVISRYKVDYENKTAQFLGFVKHNFGHANSVDYSPENKCFIVGNGSGSFLDSENYFYVYYNAYELVKNGAESLEIDDENCITYDWADTGIPKMTKVNTCWYGKNSVLIGCNNNGYVYRVSLGTDDRTLSLGDKLETEVSNFNGTWQILNTYEQADNGTIDQAPSYIGQDYAQCNQGTDYADGVLYLTCGHDGVYFWRCRLDADGSIKRDEFHKYMKIGTTTHTSAISGIICHDDYLIFTNGGYVNIYLNSALK